MMPPLCHGNWNSNSFEATSSVSSTTADDIRLQVRPYVSLSWRTRCCQNTFEYIVHVLISPVTCSSTSSVSTSSFSTADTFVNTPDEFDRTESPTAAVVLVDMSSKAYTADEDDDEEDEFAQTDPLMSVSDDQDAFVATVSTASAVEFRDDEFVAVSPSISDILPLRTLDIGLENEEGDALRSGRTEPIPAKGTPWVDLWQNPLSSAAKNTSRACPVIGRLMAQLDQLLFAFPDACRQHNEDSTDIMNINTGTG